jgi:nucleotide-binding universal stress UspA family protein
LTAIVVGIDGTDADDMVVERVAAMAHAHGAVVYLVGVCVEPLGVRLARALSRPTPTLADPLAGQETLWRSVLDERCAALHHRGVTAHAIVERGARQRVLAAVAGRVGAELIVVGARRARRRPRRPRHRGGRPVPSPAAEQVRLTRAG